MSNNKDGVQKHLQHQRHDDYDPRKCTTAIAGEAYT